jgi:TPR repeat protein
MIAKALLPFALLLAAPAPAETPPPDLRAGLEALAAEGNAEAVYHVAMLHHLGLEGLDKDPAKALALFRQAAAEGDPLGEYKLGCYYDGQGEGLVEADAEEALTHKLIAAEAGYALAQHDVAKLYYEKGDTEEALKWLLVSARQGFRPSLQALASLYIGEAKVAADLASAWAYATLLHNEAKVPDRVRKWLDDTRAKLTPDESRRAEAIIASWQIEPSPLTLKATSGLEAARELVAAPPPAER